MWDFNSYVWLDVKYILGNFQCKISTYVVGGASNYRIMSKVNALHYCCPHILRLCRALQICPELSGLTLVYF
jgi:hypothetical protein